MRRRLLLPLLSVPLVLSTLTAVSPSAARVPARAAPAPASDVLLDWQEIAVEVVYPTPSTRIPAGVPLLGFTSVAVHHAVSMSQRHGASSEPAAAVTAAFHVLSEYAPADQTSYLRERRRASMAMLDDTEDELRVGRALGYRAAARMIAGRADDGRELENQIVYDRPADPGVWQPEAPATAMAFAYLGFVDLLVLPRRVPTDGPDALHTAAYARDFEEVRTRGSSTPTTPAEVRRAATATFFNFNPAVMLGSALVAHLRQEPMGVGRTAFLFAAMHGAMTDSVITAWRLKFEEAFWRPNAAIHRADEDGNPATDPDPTWQSWLPNPAYPDYVSGHASLVSPAAEVLRRLLGERTSLDLVNTTLVETRTYPTLTALEREALHSRIWGGLHFRDAMEDGYDMGHTTARRVLRALG